VAAITMDDFEVFRARSYSAGVTLLGGLSEALRGRGEAADDQTPQRSRSCRCRPIPRADHSLADVCQLMVSAMTRMSAQEVTDATAHVACETSTSTDQPATVSVTDININIRPTTATTTTTCTTTASSTAAAAAATGQLQQQQLSLRHLSFSQQNRESGRDLSPRVNRPSDLDLGSMRPRTRSMPSRTMSQQGGKVSRRESSHQQYNRQKQQQPTGWEEQQQQHPLHCHRIRSFSTSSKRGIVNRGDSIKKCTAAAAKLQHSSSLMEAQQTNNVAQTSAQVEAFRSRACSITSACSSATSGSAAGDDTCASEPGARRVLVLGSAGVGKTLLVQQFMTSENIYTTDTADGKHYCEVRLRTPGT
jgi:flagellar biosynthesis GTPase FlhF